VVSTLPKTLPVDALGVRLGYARWDGDESLEASYELALRFAGYADGG
jgi:hypothetical protein